MAGATSTRSLFGLLVSGSKRPSLWRNFATDAGTSKVVYPNTRDEYLEAIQRAGSKTVSYFTAAWCGPCRAIAPMIDEMSTKFGQVSFLKLDIDNDKLFEVAKENEVVSVPTFVFRQGKDIVDTCVGADPRRISEGIEKLM